MNRIPLSLILVLAPLCHLSGQILSPILESPIVVSAGITQTGTPTKCETALTVSNLNCSYTATTGNSLTIGMGGYGIGSTPTGCTDGINTYTLTVTGNSGAGSAHGGIFKATSITGGSLTINCTVSANSGGLIIFIVEYSGLGGTDDGNTSASGSGTSPDSSSITTIHASDQISGLILSSTSANPCTITAGPGWTMVLYETNGTSYGCYGLETRIVSTTGMYNATATVTSAGWASIIAARY